MIRLNKSSDINFIIDARDSQGFPIRVKNTAEFTFKFYTRKCEANPVFIEASYKQGELTNIIVGQDCDELCLQKSDVEKLPSGVLHCDYYYKVANEKASDGYLDESGSLDTNIILN